MISTTTELRLGLAIAGHQVWLSGSCDDDAVVLTGSIGLDEDLVSFVHTLGDQLGFSSRDLTDLLGGLSVTLTDLECRYIRKGSAPASLSIAAGCRIGTSRAAADVEFFLSTGATGPILGLQFNTPVTLKNTPLFGGLLTHVAVDRFTVVYAAAAAAGPIVLPSRSGDVPLAGPFAPGVSLAFTLESGESQQPFVFALSPETQAVRATAAGPGGLTKWVQVQKTFGPLAIQRVGVAWNEGRLGLMLDAAVTVAALTIALNDFSLGFPLSAITDPSLGDLHVGLGGLGVSYDAGGIHVGGAFLHAGDDYVGNAVIRAATFGLTAKGAYGNDAAGNPSLFVFAMLETPLGGPPFFFVTGVAAGFGYNRSLAIPSLDDLPAFPLVAGAISDGSHPNPFAGTADDPHKALEVLHEAIAPAPGENWLAAGVRFTSFEMLQSFALATVAFGADTQIALLGLSSLSVPKGSASPIGFAQLALSATYRPSAGVLAVAGKLTPESYILSRACHLSGGFAFYTWFKDTNDGAKAGDFVLTLGGYHPLFSVPPYYPLEPRLAANWTVSSNLSVKGSFYFALTPSVVMGGGAFEAVWQSGDLRAWFETNADFLLGWKPFHYSAHLSLSLGASYTVDLLFTSATITVHLGVTLDLWGPSFAGKARVDLAVCSFTISFGDSMPLPIPIGWNEFTSSFLPPPPAQRKLAAAAEADTNDAFCDTRVTGGLLLDLSRGKTRPEDVDWILDAERFELTTSTVCPGNGGVLVTTKQNKRTAFELNDPAADFTKTDLGVGPMRVRTGALQSTHTITLNRVGDGDYDFASDGRAIAIVGWVPSAAWSDAGAGAAIAGINTNPRLVKNALTGVVLKPRIVTPDATLPVDVVALQAGGGDRLVPFWSAPAIPTTDPFDGLDAMTELTRTVAADPGGDRGRLLGDLVTQGLGIDADVRVSRLAALAGHTLSRAPRLRSLGEEKATGTP